MLYRKNQESLIVGSSEDNYQTKFVYKNFKLRFYEIFNRMLERVIKQSNARVFYKTQLLNATSEILDKAPLYANMISSRGYSNVLFVPYYDSGAKLNWLLPKNSENYIDEHYFERTHIDHVMDYDVIYQFIPAFMYMYSVLFYKQNLTVLDHHGKSKHKLVVQDFYDSMEISKVYLPEQYHIGFYFRFDKYPEKKYDAVVLLGHPNKEGATVEELRKRWGLYCTEDFDLMHIKYHGSEIVGQKKEVGGNIELAFRNRKNWDGIAKTLGCSIDYKIMERAVSIF